jgi:hypothetical protein
MASLRWELQLGVALTVTSVLAYLAHFLVFGDAHHIFIYLLGDIAFVPINVLLVTVILDRVLQQRERKARLEKLNIVIGAFFSEMGTSFLAYLSDADPRLGDIRKRLLVDNGWDDALFDAADAAIRAHDYDIDMDRIDLAVVKRDLADARPFLVRLLENPALLEHESFTTLLQAVAHVSEELGSRPSLYELPASDLLHLRGDMRRAYALLSSEWLSYMRHLKRYYPYLFSLAMRTNPFDQDSSAVVA